MTITLNSEQERIIEEEIRSGHFRTPAEVLDHALASLREKGSETAKPVQNRRSLAEVLRDSPFAGSELDLDRQKDFPRPVDL